MANHGGRSVQEVVPDWLEDTIRRLTRPGEIGSVKFHLEQQERILVCRPLLTNRKASGAVIGRRGATIDAIRLLASRMAEQCTPPAWVRIDVENLEDDRR